MCAIWFIYLIIFLQFIFQMKAEGKCGDGGSKVSAAAATVEDVIAGTR